MKLNKGLVLHQFLSRRDHLRSSTSLLVEEEVQLQEDLNSARVKLGTAANLHYLCSCHEGIPTLLSRSQIAHLCRNKSSSKNGDDTGTTEDGETDDIYKFLKESGNYYMFPFLPVAPP
jgi:hypothetical protein